MPLKIGLGMMIVAVLVIATFIINRELQKFTYKLDYPSEISKYSKQYGQDPYLVAAVIHVESGNRPGIVSPKGAVGLMQVMPATGQWISEKSGIKLAGETEKALSSPETNIEMGCWYLNYLSERFDSLELVLCAYNAGPANVTKWLSNASYSENGKLKLIPFNQTKEYVERVHSARKKYHELYSKELGPNKEIK